MKKEIHFFEYESENFFVSNSWNDTQKQIEENQQVIYTTQMGLLSTRLFEDGYRIIIHESETCAYEIKLGKENTRTNRIIRMGLNIFNLWRAGEFKNDRL